MIHLMSWGFKFGQPPANIKLDVSYLINPWRKKELRGASKKEILAFMEEQEEFNEVVNAIVNLVSVYDKLWPESKMVFAVCCSEGTYRSPMVVEAVGKKLEELKINYKT